MILEYVIQNKARRPSSQPAQTPTARRRAQTRKEKAMKPTKPECICGNPGGGTHQKWCVLSNV